MVPVNFNIWGNNGFDELREFNRNQETFVIIHGYQSTGGNVGNEFKPEDWMRDMAQALREQNSTANANIIVVDWQDGANPDRGLINSILDNAALGGASGNLVAGPPGAAVGTAGGAVTGGLTNYQKAANNTREVGSKIADKLIEEGAESDKITLIGHSLGAHTSGFAAADYQNKTGKKINRIIGLDPAGLEFQGKSIEERLDSTDAERVVNIHTSTTFGFSQRSYLNDFLGVTDDRIGDLDVFVNPYKLFQPGVGVLGAVNNHGYATKIYTDLIKGNNIPQENGQELNLDKLDTATGTFDIDTLNAIFIGSTSGEFSNGSNRLSLGTPAFESFLEFDGNDINTRTNELFKLGDLTYRNGFTNFGSEPKGDLPFDLNVSLMKPVEKSTPFKFNFNNEATRNETGDPVRDGDILTFSGAGLTSDTIKALGTDYTLDLFGFSEDDGITQVGRFNSPENSTANASLFGKITVAESRIIPPLLFNNIRSGTVKGVKGLGNFLKRSNPFSQAEIQGSLRINGLANGRIQSEQNFDPEPFIITEDMAVEFPGGVEGLEIGEQIFGSPLDDVIKGLAGTDFLTGSRGIDYILGGPDSDQVYGGKETDILNGNENDDFVSGDIGDDLIRGGKNNDTLDGGPGNDVLIGDIGTDRLTGGTDADVFILRTDTGEEKTDPTEADWILDFNAAEGDRIGINGGVPLEVLTFESADVNQDGTADTVIKYTETNEVFGTYTNIFGVVINISPDIVQNSSFTVSIEEPLLNIG